ncbi:protein kinase, putative [Entamoeba nuttalli P19]|uniref:Protein kinase, putative n=2 Tax=Entamoeba nuttalli TaxID=412467 RepID=K2HAC0_ENTNP|nr:protein kinase, putative [Entamoeba nuttalli P19]EKE39534.1 protein kinase, putative [Entamoeba nuttalli P19]|eukprot:XP_008858151.1 protein kinase, putative [Entamoeba nuttalli P19]
MKLINDRMSQFTIIIIDNYEDKRIKTFSLEKALNGIKIGRHKSCDIVLSSLMISNFHCTIKVQSKEMKNIIIYDTSSNGTQYKDEDIGKGNSVIIPFDDKISINMAPNDFYNITFSTECINIPSEVIVKGVDLMCYDKYNIIKRLGDGQYSKVYKAIIKSTNSIVALKILNQTRERFTLDEISRRELEIMKKIQHENVVSFRECFETKQNTIFEVDFCEGADLFSRIITTGKMDEHEGAFIFMQLLEGMNYLHSQHIIHRDLKPENILLKENKPYPTIKIADFGMAKIAQYGTTSCGTTQYAAPEVILPTSGRLQYTKECDIWSIGIILYIILSGTHPFSMEDENLLYKQIKDAQFNFKDAIWDVVSKEPKELIKSMIIVDPLKRASIATMLDCEWIKKNSVYFPDKKKRSSEGEEPETKRIDTTIQIDSREKV